MAVARVVSFDGVSTERMEELVRQFQSGERDVRGTEMIGLHNPDDQTALAVIIFETEEQYEQMAEELSATPAEETPGNRTSVAKYNVAIRGTA